MFLKKMVEVNKSEVSYSMNELETTQLIKTDEASVQNTRGVSLGGWHIRIVADC